MGFSLREMDPILKIANLRVEYRSREFGAETKVALHGLNLQVRPGEVFGFLGPNGADRKRVL